MDSDSINIKSNIIYKININANFYNGSVYAYTNKVFYFFLSKNKESLYNYIINNKKDFINFIKSKKDTKNNKYLIAKKDNVDFLRNFRIDHIENQSSKKHENFVIKNRIYFTDLGLITFEEWSNINEEFLI
jgi:hypothetical protein